MPEYLTVAELVGRLPHTVGHELGDTHVVVTAIRADRSRIATAAITWDDSMPDPVLATRCARQLADPFTREGAELALVVGYGPAGPDRVSLLAEELEQVTGIVTLQVHVQDGTWRTRRGLSGPWHPAEPLPPAPRDEGLGLPRSEAELRASVVPLPNPVHGAPPARTVAALAQASPQLRADVACRVLANVSTQPDPTEHLRLLAHLATADVVTRDAVLAHAIEGDDRCTKVEALVRTFRSAPPELRAGLASLAAAATYLTAGHPPVTRELLAHAGDQSGLAILVRHAMAYGINPEYLRAGLADAVSKGLAEAEAAWATKHQGFSPASSPSPSSAPEPGPSTAGRPAPAVPDL